MNSALVTSLVQKIGILLIVIQNYGGGVGLAPLMVTVGRLIDMINVQDNKNGDGSNQNQAVKLIRSAVQSDGIFMLCFLADLMASP